MGTEEKIITKWVCCEELDIQRREYLMLCLEALDRDIYRGTRRHETMKEFPYVAHRGSDVLEHVHRVSGRKDVIGTVALGYIPLRYDCLIKMLQIQIKNKIKEDEHTNQGGDSLQES